MRLRRETGDFNVVIEDGAATIQKKLSAEDLIGCIVTNGSVTEVVIEITTASTTLTLTTNSNNYTYTIATGAVVYVEPDAESEEDAGGES